MTHESEMFARFEAEIVLAEACNALGGECKCPPYREDRELSEDDYGKYGDEIARLYNAYVKTTGEIHRNKAYRRYLMACKAEEMSTPFTVYSRMKITSNTW